MASSTRIRALRRLTGDATARLIDGLVAMNAQIMADTGKGYAHGSKHAHGAEQSAGSKVARKAKAGQLGLVHRGLNPKATSKTVRNRQRRGLVR